MDDIDYDALNPGIRETVRWLRSLGFNTCDSGDGVTHEYECDGDAPYVAVRCEKENAVCECDRLYTALMEKLGLSMCPEWLYCELYYQPGDGIPVIIVGEITDAILAL